MTRFFYGLFLLFLLLAAAAGGSAQSEKAQVKPFTFGETLVYEAKASKIISGIPVAGLTFSLQRAADSENMVIKTEAVSKGTLLKIFRYSFLQQYESVVDPVTFGIIRTTKHDVQKERVRDSVADFDYLQKRVTYTETDPKDPNRPPRRIASDVPGTMNDIVSAIYSVRMMQLKVGKTFEIPISDSGLVYEIPVTIAARELQKTAIGRVWCFRVEPSVFGNDRLIEQNGKLVIWVTDDDRRIPVRGRIETDAFKVDVKIKSVSNAK
jgi:hypothetical protein